MLSRGTDGTNQSSGVCRFPKQNVGKNRRRKERDGPTVARERSQKDGNSIDLSKDMGGYISRLWSPFHGHDVSAKEAVGAVIRAANILVVLALALACAACLCMFFS